VEILNQHIYPALGFICLLQFQNRGRMLLFLTACTAQRIFLWTLKRSRANFFAMTKGTMASTDKSEVLQGTLDMMIMKTLHALGPLHGFGIARRIEQVSEDVLKLNEGTVYTSLVRLQQQGWIDSEWGTSENNRKSRFYSITRRGLKQLAVETENWERISGVIGRVLRLEGQK
jgi:transcriptional regulator